MTLYLHVRNIIPSADIFGGFIYRGIGKPQGKANWMCMFFLLSLRTARSDKLQCALLGYIPKGCHPRTSLPPLFTADNVRRASRNKLEKISEKSEGAGREIRVLRTAWEWLSALSTLLPFAYMCPRTGKRQCQRSPGRPALEESAHPSIPVSCGLASLVPTVPAPCECTGWFYSCAFSTHKTLKAKHCNVLSSCC